MEEESGQSIFQCYQCGKCTAGCPVSYAMDLTPRQIMRAIQLGLKDDVLSSSAIWVCLSCQTCSARCPIEIDIARVLETLRHQAVREKVKPGDKHIETFQRIFLGLIENRGRVHELELGVRYNVASKDPLAHSSLAVGMLKKGKITKIRPGRVKGASEIKELFRKVRSLEARAASQEPGEKSD